LAAVLLLLSFAAKAQCPDLFLKVDQHTLDMQQRMPVCAASPGTFTIRLIPGPPGPNFDFEEEHVTVRAKESNPHPGEITKESIEPQGEGTFLMTVSVGEGFPGDSEPGYEICVEGVGCLDPRVRVTNNELLTAQDIRGYLEVEALLNSRFHVTTKDVAEIEKLLREYDLSAERLLSLFSKED
jgi:hypothetical protein